MEKNWLLQTHKLLSLPEESWFSSPFLLTCHSQMVGQMFISCFWAAKLWSLFWSDTFLPPIHWLCWCVVVECTPDLVVYFIPDSHIWLLNVHLVAHMCYIATLMKIYKHWFTDRCTIYCSLHVWLVNVYSCNKRMYNIYYNKLQCVTAPCRGLQVSTGYYNLQFIQGYMCRQYYHLLLFS